MNDTAHTLKKLHSDFIKRKCADDETIQQLGSGFWQWLGKQKVCDLISLDMLHSLADERVLAHALSAFVRSDIRLIAEAAINHPINEETKLDALFDDAQVAQLAYYISQQKAQREVLIHEVIGNSGFATMLSQTISHAISDYLDNNLSKVAGVGKLVKFGKGALEKATKSNLDDSLNTYLNKNISSLTAKTENIAKKHLNDTRIEKIIIDSWNKIKTKPVAQVKKYLDDDSITHGEQLVFDGYNHIRQTTFLQTHVRDHIGTWYEAHQKDALAQVFTALYIDEQVVTDMLHEVVAPVLAKASQSDWFDAFLDQQLSEFYSSDAVTDALAN